jgi:2-polyprenyl-6-methoxyphenol hydroxylase-like FAD-dependent oxidoreductase
MHRVGIVGCGVAGTTAAYLLARQGHQITLLERASELGPVGAGILLQCSGQEVLRQLGILDPVLAHAAPLVELYARHASGGTLIRTRFADFVPGARSYGVHRGVLFKALFDLVQTQAIDICTNCEIVGRLDKSDGVVLVDARGREHGPFDFVVAADGSRSRMRAICGFSTSITEYNHGTLWLNAPGDGIALTNPRNERNAGEAEAGKCGRLLQVVERNRKLFGLLPLGDGLVSLYWGLPVREFEQVKSRGVDALKQEILKFAPESAPVLDFIDSFEQFLFTTYRHIYVRQRYDDRVILIGDAAHAMSPHLGQGINLALLDARRLAMTISDCQSPPAAFKRFHGWQRSYIRYYATVTYLLSPFFQSDWGILGWGRDWALPLLPHIPFVKRQMLMTVCGLKGGFLRGKIKV